jgi:hypothetical protein
MHHHTQAIDSIRNEGDFKRLCGGPTRAECLDTSRDPSQERLTTQLNAWENEGGTTAPPLLLRGHLSARARAGFAGRLVKFAFDRPVIRATDGWARIDEFSCSAVAFFRRPVRANRCSRLEVM